MQVAAVVLAAGASTRLGRPKQLARLGGGPWSETLLERAVRTANEAGCARIIVVLGANAAEILAQCDLGSAQVLVNEQWERGMAASIRCAVEAVYAKNEEKNGEETGASTDAVLLMTCDQPAVTAEHLRQLMMAGPSASAYAGRLGIPACLPASWFARLARLQGDRGARDLLEGARPVPLVGGELDVDTPDALEQARARFGNPCAG